VCCRKLVFDEALARLKDKAAKEEKRRRRAREDFTLLLKENIRTDMPWEEAEPMLGKFPEYRAVRHPGTQ
jgi:hypothetical protein